jgi:hypothetical protein
MKTKAEAFKEFDDKKEFYYWCSMYDDTKHIKQKGDK